MCWPSCFEKRNDFVVYIYKTKANDDGFIRYKKYINCSELSDNDILHLTRMHERKGSSGAERDRKNKQKYLNWKQKNLKN